MTIKLKRAYDPSSPDDGFRIYVDALWPRGLSHETFHYDLWEKDIAPSAGLREWFHADRQGREQEFIRRYDAELASNPAFTRLLDIVKAHPVVTLLFSSKDRIDNNAVVLRSALLAALT